jgi:hypothetical protein
MTFVLAIPVYSLSEVTARCFDVTESGELKQDLTSNEEKK